MRAAIVAVGFVFWLAFAAMTAYVIADDGLTILTLASVAILAMTALPLFNALREPPDRR